MAQPRIRVVVEGEPSTAAAVRAIAALVDRYRAREAEERQRKEAKPA